MTNRQIFTVSRVSYPSREEAMAFQGGGGMPVGSAVIGITYPTADYRIQRPASDKWFVFEYVLEGEGELLIDGAWRKAKAGDTYLLLAGEAHEYRADPKNPWKKLWVNFTSDYMGAYLSACGVRAGIYPVDTRAVFETLLRLSRSGRPYAEICFTIDECLHRIAATVAAAANAPAADEFGIREALGAAVYNKADLSDIAREVHMSKTNMIRVFKRAYGVTPYEYLLSAKIEAAKLLLKNTGMTVKEIADRVCVADEHYFSTLFLKRTGKRPRAYRTEKYKETESD